MSDMTQDVHRELHSAIDQATRLSMELTAAKELLEEAEEFIAGVREDGEEPRGYLRKLDEWLEKYQAWEKK